MVSLSTTIDEIVQSLSKTQRLAILAAAETSPGGTWALPFGINPQLRRNLRAKGLSERHTMHGERLTSLGLAVRAKLDDQ